MAKEKEHTSSTRTLLVLRAIIQSQNRYTKKELAHKHGVSTDAIDDDFRAIKNAALPIPYSLTILSEPRKKGFTTYKRTLERPTQTIGYTFDFEVKAPDEWLKVACFGGFGKLASGGFGFVNFLK